MNKKEIDNAIKYWETVAEHDYDTMLALFKTKRFSDSLFFGHITLEKVLKGLAVKKTREQAPYTHDLIRLAKLSDLGLRAEEMIFLNDVNEFNIRARYPEQKLAFYKKATPKYTKENLDKITKMYKNLCKELK